MTKLETTLNIAINSLNDGCKTKEDAISYITDFIKKNYVAREQIEQLPAGLKVAISKAVCHQRRSSNG